MTDTAEKKVGATEGGNVNIRLAHPLNPRDLIHLGHDGDEPANVNDVITVTKDQAVSLMAAGFVQVDPDDAVAVARLFGKDVEPAATSGNTTPVEPNYDGEPGPDSLRGEALDKALEDRNLSKSGTVAEKQARLAEHVADPVE